MKQLNTFLQEDGSYRYSIMAPDVVVDREERPHYEKDRFLSMEMNLQKGDVLFDVGSELGWQSAIYAKFVGPENMCLFEHARELWPTIRETWMLNDYAAPKITFCGFVSNRSTDAWCSMNEFPPAAFNKVLKNFDDWSKIHADTSGAELTLDRLVLMSNIDPDALTIDVEGAEYRVLQGCTEIFKRPRPFKRPLAWVSIHPKQRLASFNTSREAIFDFMLDCDYENQYLGVDHEEHYFFYPIERKDSIVLVNSPWKTYGKRNILFEEAIPNWQDCMGMPYASAWGARD